MRALVSWLLARTLLDDSPTLADNGVSGTSVLSATTASVRAPVVRGRGGRGRALLTPVGGPLCGDDSMGSDCDLRFTPCSGCENSIDSGEGAAGAASCFFLLTSVPGLKKDRKRAFGAFAAGA